MPAWAFATTSNCRCAWSRAPERSYTQIAMDTRTLAAGLVLALAVPALPAAAATPAAHPPNYAAQAASRKMSNLYLLAHAGAILDVCMASPDAGAFPETKAREIGDLAARLGALVRTIGTHYRDAEVPSVYEATKAQMASDTRLKFHVKNNHQNCGERTLGEMRAYVAQNEALIGKFVEKQRLEQDRRAAQPARK